MPEYWDNIRIQHLHGTETEWGQNRNKDFIPEAGEIVIYDTDKDHVNPRMKVGDGETKLSALQFTSSDKVAVDVTTGTATTPTRKEYKIVATYDENTTGEDGVITIVLYDTE